MLPLKKIVFMILALMSWAGSYEAVQISTYMKEWRMEDNETFSNGFNIIHGSDAFLYMICANDRFPTEVNCNANLERLMPDRSSFKTTCPVKVVPTEGRQLEILRNKIPANLERVGKSRAVFFWSEMEKSTGQIYTIYEMLDLTDCSRVRVLDYTGRLWTNIVTYPHGFTLILKDQSVCKELNICRLSFDERGQQIGGPVAFNTSLTAVFVNSVSATSTDKGFFVFGTSLPEMKSAAEYVSATGFSTRLLTIDDNEIETIAMVSNSYETYGLCWSQINSRTVDCAQFDASGNKKTGATFEFDKPVKALVGYNLPEGGMLVANLDCDEEMQQTLGFDIVRIRPDGSKDEVVVKVTDVNLKYDRLGNYIRYLSGVFETSHQYCFYLTNSGLPKGSSVNKYVRKCIEKENMFLRM